MSTAELQKEALSLPVEDRLTLAKSLWKSIDNQSFSDEPEHFLHELEKRDKEIIGGSVECRTHDEVMASARKAIECSE